MQASTSVVDCSGCGEQNSSDMSFCLKCGKVLSSAVQEQRDIQGVKKRQCKSCGRADELNHRYCIFCGADIKAFVAKAANPEALNKFTTELSQLTADPDPNEALQVARDQSNSAASNYHAPVVYKNKAATKPSYGALVVQLFLLLGLASGAGLAYCFKGPALLQAYNLVTGNSFKDGLLIFTEQPTVNIVTESQDRKQYTVGQTKNGSMAVSGIDPGVQRITFSLPDASIIEAVTLLPSKLNMLGYDQKVDVNAGKH